MTQEQKKKTIVDGIDGYGNFSEGLEEVKCVNGKSYKAKTFTFQLDEKEMFAAEVIDKNHPHHDWLIAHRSNGVGCNIFMICRKCKCIYEISNVENW